MPLSLLAFALHHQTVQVLVYVQLSFHTPGAIGASTAASDMWHTAVSNVLYTSIYVP